MTITIGVQMGGPEQRGGDVRKALLVAMNAAADARNPTYDDGSEAWVNAIYIVPGSLLKPEFDGYELGHFSKKEKGIVVKIAVPQAVADGSGLIGFILESLHEAVRIAAARYAVKKINFSILRAEMLILKIEAALKRECQSKG